MSNTRNPIDRAIQTAAAPAGGFVARLVASELPARRAANLLAEALDPGEVACAAFARPDGDWQVEMYFREFPEHARLRAMIALVGGEPLASTLNLEPMKPRDWVRDSLKALKPVPAGRFMVHGAHDRARVPSHCFGIEIEAATAFGTGHHGTTRGCLLALDRLARHRRAHHILDLGTGSGVLAIAAAKLFRAPVLAIDIDPGAVRVARDNARRNGVGDLVTVAHCSSMFARDVAVRAPFDLVLANILLQPLRRLAAPMARQLMPNAHVVLSGLLTQQANAALSAYRSQGLVLERAIVLDGWITPTMRAKSG